MRPKNLADFGFADITPPEPEHESFFKKRSFPKEFYDLAKALHKIGRLDIAKENFSERITYEEFKLKAEEILSSQPTNNNTL